MPTQATYRTDLDGPRLLHVAVLALAAGPEPSTRRRVFAMVSAEPGLHLRELARRLELRPSHADYHLRQLAKAGLVKHERSGGYTRYFVTVQGAPPERAVAPVDRAWVALLREARPLEIVAHLLQRGPMEMGGLAERMSIAPSTLTHHVTKLDDAGIVERTREGNKRFLVLADRERLVDVLLRHEPPDDLVQSFEDVWDDIGL